MRQLLLRHMESLQLSYPWCNKQSDSWILLPFEDSVGIRLQERSLGWRKTQIQSLPLFFPQLNGP